MKNAIFILLFYSLSLGINAQEIAASLGEAYKAYEENKFEQSVELLTEIEINQSSYHVYKLLGDALHKLDKFNEAVSAYDKAELFNSSDTELYTHRGAAKISLNDLNGALQDLNQALIIDEQNTMALYYRGTVFYLQYKYKQALKDYDYCIKINPNYASSWYMKAACKGELEQYESAMHDYAKAYDLDPKLELAIFNIAVLKYLNEDYQSAINDFSQLLSSDLNNKDEMYFYRAECHHYLNQKQDACKDYLKSKELGDEESASIYDKFCLKGMNRGRTIKRIRTTGAIEL